MEYVVLVAIVVGAFVIAADAVRQRRHRRRKPNAGRILAQRIQASSGGLDVQALLGAGTLTSSSATVLGTLRTPPVAGTADASEDRSEAGLGGIWDALAGAIDPETFRPRLSEGVEVVIFRLRWGDDYAMIATPDRTLHYQIEPWEAELLERMDGTRTVSELIVERLQEDGDLDTGAVLSLVDLLRTGSFLGSTPLDVPSLVRDRLDPASPARRRLREFGKTLKLPWHGAERFTKAAYRAGLRLAFRPIGLLLVVSLALVGLVAFVAVVRSGRFELKLQAAPAEAAILLTLGFFLTFAHELGHALTLVHYDRRVLSAGFFIFFGSPAFFVDASDVLMLDSRRRIAQAFAGAMAELFLAGIASIVLFLFPDTSVAGLMYRFAFINYFVILENLVPLLRLDGYWILVDLIQVPDLRSRSLAFLQSDVWHKLRARERFTIQEVGLGLYGIVGFAYTVLSFAIAIVFWNLLFGDIVRGLWQGGLGSRALLLLLAIFFGGPILRAGIALLRAIWRRLQGYLARIRFRFERSWRIEAAELIDDLPAFDDLPEELLSSLAGRVRLRTLPPGHAVFRQGDRAEAFYVIRSGTVNVEEEDPETGDTRVVRAMGRGESFGELALLGSAPRAATVRTTKNVQLFEIGKGTFDRLLLDEIRAPSFGPTLQAFAELRSLSPFKRLSTEELSQILDHGAWSVHPPGAVIIQQGEPGDAFYAIGSGRADVEKDGRRINTLGPGDYFGELALLDDAPRSASVIARTPLRGFRLDREGFDGVIASSFRRGAGPRTERNLEH